MNWTYNGKEIDNVKQMPLDTYGFVYLIKTEDNRYYIGKKNLYTERNKQIAESTWRRWKKEGVEGLHKTKNKKKSKKGKPVWRYKIFEKKESNWKTYNSSNKKLADDIKKGMKVEKRILAFAHSSKHLSYLEVKMLMVNEVLEHPDKFINDNIEGRYFPKDLIKK